MARSVAIALLLASVTQVSAIQAGEASEIPDPEVLKRLVHQDCGSCHGLTLKGGLGPDLRPQNLDHHDVDSLSGVILDGIPGTAMPPWRPLISVETADWIAQYLLKPEAK
ncbi:MAG: cytochrome c [Stappiaceae bacterium]